MCVSVCALTGQQPAPICVQSDTLSVFSSGAASLFTRKPRDLLLVVRDTRLTHFHSDLLHALLPLLMFARICQDFVHFFYFHLILYLKGRENKKYLTKKKKEGAEAAMEVFVLLLGQK